MKKVIIYLLFFVFVFSLCACGNAEVGNLESVNKTANAKLAVNVDSEEEETSNPYHGKHEHQKCTEKCDYPKHSEEKPAPHVCDENCEENCELAFDRPQHGKGQQHGKRNW